MPMSPFSASSAVSAFTQWSETTLRELTISPTSTLAAVRASPSPSSFARRHERELQHHQLHGYRRHLAPTPLSGSLSVPPSPSAATSTETLQPRHAGEYSRGNLRVYDTESHPDWWHVELREMRADPNPDISFGEAV